MARKRRQRSQPVWTDPCTGLSWQWESPGEMTWHEALDYAASLSLGGFGDWRLPTVKELEGLLDRDQLFDTTRYRAGWRETVPFKDAGTYWSSTTFGNHRDNAWIVMFDGGYVLSYSKQNRYGVRCVRGPVGRTGTPRTQQQERMR